MHPSPKPMRISSRPTVARQWRLATQQAVRYLKSEPPPIREYQKATRGKPRTPSVEELLPPPPKPGFLSRLFPERESKPLMEEPRDLERGIEASRRVVKDGVLDQRYKNAGKVYIRLIVALPLAIYLSYELYRRRFLGAEQKAIPAKSAKINAGEGKGKKDEVS